MEWTGVFATEEELADLRSLASRGWQQGEIYIVSSVLQGILKDQATIDALKTCHELALKHKLPEIDGYYGVGGNGEFVKA